MIVMSGPYTGYFRLHLPYRRGNCGALERRSELGARALPAAKWLASNRSSHRRGPRGPLRPWRYDFLFGCTSGVGPLGQRFLLCVHRLVSIFFSWFLPRHRRFTMCQRPLKFVPFQPRGRTPKRVTAWIGGPRRLVYTTGTQFPV